jgi:hypothetical protein
MGYSDAILNTVNRKGRSFSNGGKILSETILCSDPEP